MKASSSEAGLRPSASPRLLASLSLAALGVVFGDIGTSPLYALRECLHGPHSVAPEPANVLGILSLVFWSMTLVVSIKYLAYVLRADNRGEGGILALMALAQKGSQRSRTQRGVTILGLFGAALLYGDGAITPAISVLGAVEGLEVAAPGLHAYVVPTAIVILVALFAVQRRGTARIGAVFGPVMLVWFGTLAVLGVNQIVRHPGVLLALSPAHAVSFFTRNGLSGGVVLGSVFLVVTGGEALYADMGHFGKRPIRIAWFGVAFGGLLLNYLGQGALLIQDPGAAGNPFFRMAPAWALLPLIGLSTLAAIIASQALITGAYSLTRQAIMLGYLPRLRILHTSAEQIGQIYLPGVNWALMLATLGLVVGFRSSSGLAAAYGIAVTLTMVITTLLAHVVARRCWHWSAVAALAVTMLLLLPDLAFLGANLVKIPDGGWLPLVLGAAILTSFATWKRGRELLAERFREQLVPLEDFFELLRVERPARVPGLSIYMTSNANGTPPALLQNFTHNRIVHQSVALLTITVEEVPRVDDGRFTVEELTDGFFRVQARYGFMETPNVPELLAHAGLPGYSPEHSTFVLGRETVLATSAPGMALWREHLFAFMTRNAQPATAFFSLPPHRVLELGAQVEL